MENYAFDKPGAAEIKRVFPTVGSPVYQYAVLKNARFYRGRRVERIVNVKRWSRGRHTASQITLGDTVNLEYDTFFLYSYRGAVYVGGRGKNKGYVALGIYRHLTAEIRAVDRKVASKAFEDRYDIVGF